MSRRRSVVLVLLGIVLVGGAIALHSLPAIVRRLAIARIHALTERPVRIDAVGVNVFAGRLSIRGLHIAERDGSGTFANVQRLDIRVHPLSLLFGPLHVRDLVVDHSTVHVIRLANDEFNFSDLIRSSGARSKPFDITVDHFALSHGTVTLEDRALPQRRTWTSEHITLDAHNVSTRRADGTAVGRSVTAGAPVSVQVTHLRLYPIHLEARVTVTGLDLTPARVYLPPDATLRLNQGRMSTSLVLKLDARKGIDAHGNVRLEDVVLNRAHGGGVLALVPGMTIQVAGLGIHDGDLRLERLGVEGTVSVRDPRAKPGAPLLGPSTVKANVADLTWPATTPGRVDLLTSIPGGGKLQVTGTLRPPPAPTQLRLHLAGLDLATWAQFVPTSARVTGVAEADLRMNEPFAAGIPAHVKGTIAVNRLGVADARHEVLGAQRVEASGLELDWPTRLDIKRVLVSSPRALVERDRRGNFPAKDLLSRAATPSSSSTASSSTPTGGAAASTSPTTSLGIDIGEVAVRHGALLWHDESVSPAARLDVSAIDVAVTGARWPLHGPLGVRGTLRPPGGGSLRVTGRVGLEPVGADLHVVMRKAPLAPYQPYVPTAARVSGAADADLAVAVPSLASERATARGTIGVSGVDVREGERTFVHIDRATARGVDVDWPHRVTIDRLALGRPWLLVERDQKGTLALRPLLTPRATAGTPSQAATGPAPSSEGPGTPTAITVARLTIDDGGLRVVDRSVSPPFAVDVERARLEADGLSTASANPTRVDLSANVGPTAELTMRGTVRAFGGPLLVDVSGELRDFSLDRMNPYLLRQVGWEASEGRLTTSLRCRVHADALSARTDLRLSGLELVKAQRPDEAQKRIGLPLGMIVALMKDRRGDIGLSFPIGGSLGDPRFDFKEALWSAVRSVAIHAITLPISLIGRVHLTPGDRIEQIQIDPIPFEPGTATLTSEGQGQTARLSAFLAKLPAVRMDLTPVVSSRDVLEIRRRALEETLERMTSEQRMSRDAAVTRLFEQRFPNVPPPATLDATFAALLEREPTPSSAIPDLARRRLAVVRATVEQSGIDPGRLIAGKLVQRDNAEGDIELGVRQPETSKPSKVREVLRRLGLPLKGPDAAQ